MEIEKMKIKFDIKIKEIDYELIFVKDFYDD
jgi:hypothetical protein